MNSKNKISRRGFIGAVAALGTVAIAGCATKTATGLSQAADRSTGRLPDRGEFVVRGAHVLTMDPALGELDRGDIHVRAGEIVAVGSNLVAPGAVTIDGRAMIALPGLIDTHSHLWNSPLRNLVGEGPKLGYFALTLGLGQQYTPMDIYRGVRLGVAEMLYSGITTVHDWSHNIRAPAYADADLRALRDMGVRALFSYGTPQGGLAPDDPMDLSDLARVQREWFAKPNDGLLTLGMASRSLSTSPRQVLEMATINGARDLGIADRVGSLTPGKRADLILVRATDLNMAPLGDPLQAIVRSAQPHNVDTVVVDGHVLKRAGQMTAVDQEQIVREAAESLAALKTRAGL